MWKVTFNAPFPLVVRLVLLSKSLGGIEQPEQQIEPERHRLSFEFPDNQNGYKAYEEGSRMIYQWLAREDN